jgi:hypothetical protein
MGIEPIELSRNISELGCLKNPSATGVRIFTLNCLGAESDHGTSSMQRRRLGLGDVRLFIAPTPHVGYYRAANRRLYDDPPSGPLQCTLVLWPAVSGLISVAPNSCRNAA